MEDDIWRTERDETVWGPFGVASLAATHWLDATPRVFEGAPGVWRERDGAAVGTVDDREVEIEPGSQTLHDGVLLRAIVRDGTTALRVFDPGAAARRGISRIVRFAHDPAARVRGTFLAVARDPIATVAVDGHRAVATAAGTLAFAWQGAEVTLGVERRGDELFSAFSDATSGVESHRFRHLRVPAPPRGEDVLVDLNRVTLPPCAFSDHYLCVLPPPTHRLGVAVRAGEARVE